MFEFKKLCGMAVLLGVLMSGIASVVNAKEDSKECAGGKMSWTILDLGADGRVDVSNIKLYIGSSIGRVDVPWIVKYFGVTEPKDVIGKTFQAGCEVDTDGNVRFQEPLNELNMIAVREMHGGQYVPPSNEVLYRRVIEALAKMQQPNFDDVDRNTVYQAFSRMYYGGDNKWQMGAADPKFVVKLIQDIANESSERVHLLKAGRAEFHTHSSCGCEEYLKLVSSDGRVQRIIVGPYEIPVMFDN